MDKQSIWRRPVKPLLGWLVLALVAAGLIGSFYCLQWKKPKRVSYYADDSFVVSNLTGQGDLGQGGLPNTKASPVPKYDDLPFTDEGVTWLSDFKALDDLGLIVIPELTKQQMEKAAISEYKGVTYQKVGEDNGKDIIVATLRLEFAEPGGANAGETYQFLKESDSSYQLMSAHSTSKYKGEKNYPSLITFSNKVTGESYKKYNSLAYRKTINIGDAVLEALSYSASIDAPYDAVIGSAFNNEAATPKELAKLPIGTVYLHQFPQGDDYRIEVAVLKRLNGTAEMYDLPVPFSKDDYSVTITWNDGTKNEDQYRFDGIPKGCGAPFGSAIIGTVSSDALAESGKGSSGDVVYDFKDTSHPVLKAAYDSYATFYKDMQAAIAKDPKNYNSDYDKKIAATKILTLEEYRAKHGVIVFKDALGRYAFLTSMEYAPQVECGKPVIYLYPEKPSKVSVKVGADVTISEPNYGKGWTAQADPSGTLVVNGKTYASLYWEGKGHGQYPAITEGFIVAQADADRTIREHLTTLGLNSKESADFMEFWAPRLPKTPYVRLTWFGTRQLDQLAPLAVSPKPDTMIRVFLDFEGLQQPVDIRPQRLGAVSRNGFTLVEWGGLLH